MNTIIISYRGYDEDDEPCWHTVRFPFNEVKTIYKTDDVFIVVFKDYSIQEISTDYHRAIKITIE